MQRLTEIAPGVLVATAGYATTTTTVVTAAGGSCLVIDPAVTVADLSALAAELAGRGLRRLAEVPGVRWLVPGHGHVTGAAGPSQGMCVAPPGKATRSANSARSWPGAVCPAAAIISSRLAVMTASAAGAAYRGTAPSSRLHRTWSQCG